MNFNWQKINDYQDIIYEKMDGIAKVTINRPEVRNAFRPETIIEMYDAFVDAREDQSIGVVLLTKRITNFLIIFFYFNISN